MAGSKGADALRLDRQICFAIYKAQHAFTSVYRPLLSELGLTYPQYLVMIALWEHGDRTVKDLGTALELDSGTLSPLLKRLEAIGFIKRARSTGDERVVVISLTQQGSDLSKKAADVPPKIFNAGQLPMNDYKELHRLLGDLTSALHEHGSEPTPPTREHA